MLSGHYYYYFFEFVIFFSNSYFLCFVVIVSVVSFLAKRVRPNSAIMEEEEVLCAIDQFLDELARSSEESNAESCDDDDGITAHKSKQGKEKPPTLSHLQRRILTRVKIPLLLKCIENNREAEFKQRISVLKPDELAFVTEFRGESKENLVPMLILTIMMRRYDMARELVQTYNIPVTQTGMLEIAEGQRVEEATTVWAAALAGDLPTIKLLLKHGADINQATLTGSTPLRVACFKGYEDIITFLLAKGADINSKIIYYKTTNLMVACFHKKMKVLKLLLEHGVRMNDQDYLGRTTLHLAAQMGRLDLVKILLSYGCDLNVQDNRGVTPIQIAAEYAKDDVVSYLIDYTRDSIDVKAIIEIKEFLGASFIQNKFVLDGTDKHRALFHWSESLRMRRDYGIPKSPSTLDSPLYKERKEFEDDNELAALMVSGNTEELVLQSYMLKYRITNGIASFPVGITYQGMLQARNGNHYMAHLMWHETLRLHSINQEPLGEDLWHLVDLMLDIRSFELDISNYRGFLAQLLVATMAELDRTLSKLDQEIHPLELEPIKAILHKCPELLLALLDMLFDADGSSGNEKLDFKVKQEIYTLSKKDWRLEEIRKQPSLLHLVCNPDFKLMNHMKNNCQVLFPSLKLVNLLLQCGFDPNSLDHERNTPLHLACKTSSSACVEALVEAGAEIGVCNIHGERPLNATASHPAIQKALNLKTIAAIAIKTRLAENDPNISRDLVKFVKRCHHCPRRHAWSANIPGNYSRFAVVRPNQIFGLF